MGSLRSDCDGTEVVTEEGTHPEAREKCIHMFRIDSVIDFINDSAHLLSGMKMGIWYRNYFK
ncbi:hypothetical protein [Thermoflavimicrobium dichotomicum]|uniref:hypothetical protein n=1 Tax=Thermoflavimicrobium dichotomicum TaxID=46223 RepID=UPI001587AA7B|nr:hypothetical protein [Thermoflavimicrobium dichotomicum]